MGREMATVGARIKTAREAMFMSVRELAAEVGYSVAQMYKYESGATPVPLDVLERIAKALGRPVNYFVGEQGEYQTKIEDLSLIKDHLLRTQRKLGALAEALEITMIPILGRIPAGPPQEAIETIEGYEPVPAYLAHGRNLYALRVHGWSMRDAGIAEGDVVVVDPQGEVRPGRTVIALIEDAEATMKRWGCVKNGSVVLLPANKEHESIRVPLRNVRILGVVVRVSKEV